MLLSARLTVHSQLDKDDNGLYAVQHYLTQNLMEKII